MNAEPSTGLRLLPPRAGSRASSKNTAVTPGRAGAVPPAAPRTMPARSRRYGEPPDTQSDTLTTGNRRTPRHVLDTARAEYRQFKTGRTPRDAHPPFSCNSRLRAAARVVDVHSCAQPVQSHGIARLARCPRVLCALDGSVPAFQCPPGGAVRPRVEAAPQAHPNTRQFIARVLDVRRRHSGDPVYRSAVVRVARTAPTPQTD
jgi:hypothetical protein